MSDQIHYQESLDSSGEYFLDRPRIENLLEDALQKPLTVVVAGAGYGKTHAITSVLAIADYKYAWLQLFEIDNTAAILWKRLTNAVDVYNPGLAKKMQSLGFPDSPSSFFQLIQLIEAVLKYSARFVLVVDDFHVLRNKKGVDLFEKLISANIPNLSIVLISRETPSVPLARMLSNGLMTLINEDDLRFTKSEMEDYFRMLGETLGAASSSYLYDYTEGWILAIKLIGLSLKRDKVSNQNPLLQFKVDIFALVEEEIFHFASDEMKKFLIILALLNDPPIGLVKELAMDKPEILAKIGKLKLLIRYDPHAKCYRMHNVLKDFLSEKMDLLTYEKIKNVHFSAARWYKDHHYPEEAVNHYMKCNCYSEIYDIILSVRNRVTKDVADLFITLIEQSPDWIIKERPIMRVVKAKHLFNNNRIQEALDTLIVIRTEYEALPSTQERFALLGEVYILLALISIVNQSFDFVVFFKKADEFLPFGSFLIDCHLNIAEGLNITGIGRSIPGELERYQSALFEAAPYAAKVMNGCGYGMEYLNAADAAFMTGNNRSAEEYAYEAIYRAQQQYQHGIEFMANFYLMRILVYKGDYSKIAPMLKLLKEKVELLQNADCMTLFDIIEGWFFTKIGQPTRVAKWILHEVETRKMLAPVILGREYLVRSDCLLEEGKYSELLAFMKQSDVIYEQRGVLYAKIQNKITEAIIHHYLGNRMESMNALQIAYDLSHGNHLVIQYIEYGSKMRAVAKAAMKDKDCKIPLVWLENILTKSSTYAKRLAQVTRDYDNENLQSKRGQNKLSKREVEILTCICQGLTKNEIADTCNLSINTITRIRQNICTKLGAINTFDAIRIATMMGIL